MWPVKFQELFVENKIPKKPTVTYSESFYIYTQLLLQCKVLVLRSVALIVTKLIKIVDFAVNTDSRAYYVSNTCLIKNIKFP